MRKINLIKTYIISGIIMFFVIFIFTALFVKCAGGFVKTNMVDFSHTLTWTEMISEFPAIAFFSLISVFFFLYAIRKKK